MDKFGVDIGAINKIPTGPDKIVCFWLEDWKKNLITSNRAASNFRFIKKYKGLVFNEIDTNENFTISCEKCTGSHSEVVGGM